MFKLNHAVWLGAVLVLAGCGDDSASSSRSSNVGGQSAAGGSVATGGGGQTMDSNMGGQPSSAGMAESGGTPAQVPAIGAPESDPVAIDHAMVVDAIRSNLTRHIDEIDSILGMVETSNIIDGFIDLFSSESESVVVIDASPPGDGMDQMDPEPEPQPEPEPEPQEDDDEFEIDLSELRDGLIDIMLERLVVEENATVADDGKSIVYALTKETLCKPDSDEEDQSPEAVADRARDEMECQERIGDTPLRIHVTSSGPKKITLSFQVDADKNTALRIQLHDDRLAGFLTVTHLKPIMELIFDKGSEIVPNTYEGELAFDVKREAKEHFVARFAVLKDIRMGSGDKPALALRLDADPSPGQITLNKSALAIEGAIELGQMNLGLPWQTIVDLFHDDEDEVESQCSNNSDTVDACSQYRDSCLTQCEQGGDDPVCRQQCRDQLSPELQAAFDNLATCLDSAEAQTCMEGDVGCMRGVCAEQYDSIDSFCDYRETCMDVSIPAPPAPDVDGQLSVLIPGLQAEINFNGTEDILALSKIGIGDTALKVDVNGKDIIQVNFNPEDGREGSITLDGSAGGDFSIMVDKVLDARVTFTMKNVSDVYDDLPDVLSDDTIGIRMDGSDMPTMQTIDNGRDKDMKVMSGRLTLSSPNMEQDVVIEAGMCMGSIDEDNLSEEEKEGRHDLFGDLIGEMCGG